MRRGITDLFGVSRTVLTNDVRVGAEEGRTFVGMPHPIRDNRRGDARAEGNAITAEQAATLRKMVADSRADEQAFLRFAGAKSYEEIGERRYAEVHAALEKKMGVKP